MHWAIGLVIGVLLAVVGYFVYLYMMAKYKENQEEEELEEEPPRKMANLSRMALPPPMPPLPAQPRLPMVQPPKPPPPPQMVQKQLPKWTMKDEDYVPAKLPPIEEFNDIRTFDIAKLPFQATDLRIKNCISAELVKAVIPQGEYTIDSTENTFYINGPNGTSDALNIPIGDYTISTLVSAFETQVQGTGADVFATPANFSCSYTALTSTVSMSHSTPETFTIHFTEPQLAYSLGFATIAPPEPSGGQISFSVKGPNGTVHLSTPAQSVTLSELAAAIQSSVRSTGTSVFADASGFTATVSSTEPVKIVMGHSTPEAFIFTFGSSQLAQSWGLSYVTAVSGASSVTGPNRVDLFGKRTVQVKTLEFEPDHYQGIMQEIHVSDTLTFWENNLDPRLYERRFRRPRNISSLNFSILTRHPFSNSKDDFAQLDINGVMPHLTVCFRCLRYSDKEIADPTLELS